MKTICGNENKDDREKTTWNMEDEFLHSENIRRDASVVSSETRQEIHDDQTG